MPLVEKSKPVSQLRVSEFEAILFVGGQAPMYTFYDDERVHNLQPYRTKRGKLLPSSVTQPPFC